MKTKLNSCVKRYSCFALILVVIGILIIYKAAFTMYFDDEYWLKVKERFTSTNQPIPPVRGSILSDDGRYLSSLLPKYHIYLDFVVNDPTPKKQVRLQKERDSTFLSKVDSLSQGLSEIFPDKSAAAFKRHLLKGMKRKSRHWLIYHARIPYIAYKRVRTLPYINLSKWRNGFHVEIFEQRSKPFGTLASRTIGDMYPGKNIPQYGLELYYNDHLAGKPGIKHRQRVRNKWADFVDIPQQDGHDIQTTINVEMQDVCENKLYNQLKKLGATWGVCLLMEVKTGDIKAIVNLSRTAGGGYREMKNYAVSNLMEPGSIFKPVSFLVAMNDGKISMQQSVNTGNGLMPMYGRTMRDHNWHRGGYGVLTVPEILQKSSNIGVSYLIDQAYAKNPEAFVEGIYRTGIANNLHIPIPGYAKPRIRKPHKDRSNWSHTTLPWMSIGYETQIPPISMLTFYNGLANNGKMMRPRLVKAILSKGEVIKELPPIVEREHMASAKAVQDIQTCLEWVVSKGLGKQAGSAYFPVSGKTGTAQIWTKNGFSSQYLISFAGYFPSDNPQYSMIVCMQKGAPASGGLHCGTVFRQVAEAIMAKKIKQTTALVPDTAHTLAPFVMRGNIAAAERLLKTLEQPVKTAHQTADMEHTPVIWGEASSTPQAIELTPEPSASAPHHMPNVIGMGAKDAVYRLEEAGLHVSLTGVGKVSAQSIKPSTTIKRGMRVHLTLTEPWSKDAKNTLPQPPTETEGTKTPPAPPIRTQDEKQKGKKTTPSKEKAPHKRPS